ncbi:MAG: hypothetical protein WD894_10660 [Pirellulales bacterium]
MSLQLRASKHQLADFKRIAELGSGRLEEVRERLQQLDKPTLHPQELIGIVRKLLAEDAEPLVRELLSFQGLVRQTGRPVEDVISGIHDAIERQGADSGLDSTAWADVEEAIKLLVQEKSVRLTARAIELAYDYANLLRRTKILTDIRPLFDENADKIEGAVVSYTLRLHFNSADGEHELSIALDEGDIQVLIAQCNRALKKAATSRSLMSDKCSLPVAVSGEPNDD